MSANFKDRLQEAMRLRDVTAAELSRKTGLSKAQLSQYVNGTYEAKQLALHKLAVALNVSEVWLMGYDVPCERQIINASDFSEKEKIVILAYRNHPAMQDAVDTLLGIEKQPEKKLSPTVSHIKPAKKTYIVRTAATVRSGIEPTRKQRNLLLTKRLRRQLR